MKLVRLAVATALSASALVTVHAAGAAALPCKLITDGTGDADIQSGVGNDTSLDLTSADIAADKKRLTMVMRVDKASLKGATVPVGTIKMNGYFSIGSDKYFVSVLSDGTKVSGNFGTVGTGKNDILTNPEATIDIPKNEARITVPLGDFPFPYKVGGTITDISATTSGGVVAFDTGAGIAGSTGGLYGDTAEDASKTYKIGAKNCVVLGK